MKEDNWINLLIKKTQLPTFLFWVIFCFNIIGFLILMLGILFFCGVFDIEPFKYDVTYLMGMITIGLLIIGSSFTYGVTFWQKESQNKENIKLKNKLFLKEKAYNLFLSLRKEVLSDIEINLDNLQENEINFKIDFRYKKIELLKDWKIFVLNSRNNFELIYIQENLNNILIGKSYYYFNTNIQEHTLINFKEWIEKNNGYIISEAELDETSKNLWESKDIRDIIHKQRENKIF